MAVDIRPCWPSLLHVFGKAYNWTEEQAQNLLVQFRNWVAEYVVALLFGVNPDEDVNDPTVVRTKLAEAVKEAAAPMIAEMFGITDPDKARSVVQTLVNQAVDTATQPLLERIRRLEEERPGSPSFGQPQAQRDPETVRTEIVPGIVVAVMNGRKALESLNDKEKQALKIDKTDVSGEFVQRIWDLGILKDFWGSEEGLRERRMEIVAEFIDTEMEAMVSAMEKNLKRSKAAREKANMAWAQYFLVRLGVDPADAKAVRTAMSRQAELKAYLK